MSSSAMARSFQSSALETGGMNARDHVDAWIKAGGFPQTDLEARLVRRVPDLAESFNDRLKDPILRALAGLDGDPKTGKTLVDRLRLGVAGLSYEIADLHEMEEEARASGDPHLWVIAARLHAEKNIGREAAARMALSEQALPLLSLPENIPACFGEHKAIEIRSH